MQTMVYLLTILTPPLHICVQVVVSVYIHIHMNQRIVKGVKGGEIVAKRLAPPSDFQASVYNQDTLSQQHDEKSFSIFCEK